MFVVTVKRTYIKQSCTSTVPQNLYRLTHFILSCRPALSQTVLKAWLLRQLMVVWRKEWRWEIEEMMTLSLMAARCERDDWGRLGSFSESLLSINWWSTSTALSSADANKSEACESNVSKECSGLDKKPNTDDSHLGLITFWWHWHLIHLASAHPVQP